MVFLFLLLILFILILAIITTKIQMEIIDLKIDSQNIKYNYKIVFKLKIFSNIPIIKITMTQEKIKKMQKKLLTHKNIKKIQEKINISENIKQLEKNIFTNKIDLKTLETIKTFFKSVQIDIINLEIQLCTENAMLTSLIVAIIASIISINISQTNNKKVFYKIEPIYNNQNLIRIIFSGIFQIKLIHIINIIYVLNRKGGKNKYERTSNRRSYDYSYE